METSLKPQPLVAEVLPGFTTLCILGFAYLANHPGELTSLLKEKSATEVISAGFATLLAAWIIGTVYDAIRDIVEHLLDRWFPVNWQFLFNGPSEAVQKLDESWLAYYFLSGNSTIGLIVSAGLGAALSPVHITPAWLALLIICALIFGVDSWFLRTEIRRMIGFEIGKMPHDGVFARIKPADSKSPGRGVGVFAIGDIPKGTLVFAPDDDPTVVVKRSDVETLPDKLKRLYHDFCPLEGDRYTCPVNFNKLTPSWYANNNSTEPNIAPDKDLRFRALRDIAAGEELTSRYTDYSENENSALL
jgi:hypothetical protein